MMKGGLKDNSGQTGGMESRIKSNKHLLLDSTDGSATAGSVVTTGNRAAKMRRVEEGTGANLSASSCVTTNDFYGVSGGITKETSKNGKVQAKCYWWDWW